MTTATMEAPSAIADLSLKITQQIRVNAPIETTFNALLEQLGPRNERPDGTPMPCKIEPFPGGRWYRDLGENNGHFWANVQAIKRPTLLELTGPLFMSHPVANNVQYRLREEGDETVIEFCHAGFGLIPEEFKKNVVSGWTYVHEQAKKHAEAERK